VTDTDRTAAHTNMVLAYLSQLNVQAADEYLTQVVLAQDGADVYERVCDQVALRTGTRPKGTF
jgi:hypothetical protein